MAQFWVNDTPGGPGPFLCQQAMDHGDGEDPAAPLWVSRTPTPVLGARSWEGGLEQGWVLSLLPGIIPTQLEGAPAAPQHQAGSGGRLRAASGYGCPTLICCQMCVTTPRTETGGCTGAQWPWSAWGGRVTCHHHSSACRGASTGDKVPQSITQLTSCQERK